MLLHAYARGFYHLYHPAITTDQVSIKQLTTFAEVLPLSRGLAYAKTMCPYRKTIYQCNHSTVNPSPIGICQSQADYESGQRLYPCNRVYTHGRNNIKVSTLCPNCHQRKETTDRQFVSVKTRLSELRAELEKKYGRCMAHLDEAGLEPEEKPSSRKEPDPAQEFLKKKRLETDAHLMMFWDCR
ncbi:hypothetical protein F5Y05DRAFT_369941 [Hypoxylon sp. FL0543]|nr:hypothetical protein F5Y05DRAFT_369941 [Hypoxylon sp. FL0543]